PIVPFEDVLTSDTVWGTNYIIEHYNSTDGQVYRYDSNDVLNSNLTEVSPDYGYWVYTDVDRTLTFLGTEGGVRTLNLVPGINMVGWTSLNSLQMDLGLWYIMNNVSSVEIQDISDLTQQLLLEADVSLDSFESGKGYIINLTLETTEDVEWNYVLNIAPFANAGADKSVYVSDSFSLDGSSSYDLDGSIVSYTWTYAGVNKTGVTTSYSFDAVGTYTILLIVEDNEGATSTDQVIITVTNVPVNGGGGGGGGGIADTGSNSLPGGFIQISLDAPNSMTVIQGTPYTFQATVSNTGHVDVYDVTIEGVPPWISISPGLYSRIEKDTSVTFDITIILPEGKLGSQFLTLTAYGTHPNATVESSVTIEIIGNAANCDTCEQPSDWTVCNVNGTQSRIVYTCDEETGFNCVETTEERSCAGITGYFLYLTDNPLLSAIVGLIIIAGIGVVVLHRKGKLKGISKKISGAFKKKPSAPKKKQEGIDFSINYGDK
ncbi:MAG: PKD domain-containing protein, partial [Nanoarchaeota archaeon]|nr:PKD domain-containing protein [Nanoarchaeota archaeon]